MTSPFLAHFTPSLMSQATLEAIFVQRQPLAERLVTLTRESILTPSKHYTLLIGPRGIGKTHLLALLYHRLTAMGDLRDGMRLAWLREEEWGVTSFLELLLRIFTALREAYPGDDLAARVTALYHLPAAEAEQQARTLLREYCGSRTLVLFMENLDELFAELGEDGQQRWRAYLQEHPFCTIVATAQSLFPGVSRHTSPFYGFFRLHHLQELQFEEAVQLLIRLAHCEQKTDLVAFLQGPRGRARVQAIAHLAGGNHRVYVMLAQFLTRQSLDELVEPFLEMLDHLTPYNQARMAWLSSQQRKMVNVLCNERGALAVKDLAQRCFMSQQTAASQLHKLQQMGYVHANAAGRESLYELREPLMRMGMEVKKFRGQPVRLLVEFLRYWYTPGELEARGESISPWEDEGEGTRRHEDAIAGYDETITQFALATAIDLQEQVATAMFNKGCRLSMLGRSEEALRVYDALLERFAQAPAPALQETVATSCYLRAITLFFLHRWDDALQALDGALRRCPHAHDQLRDTPAAVSLRLLLTSTDTQLWPARIKALLECYDQHEALVSLGQGLVRNIVTLYSPMISRTAAQTWRDLWKQQGEQHEALVIPLRLLDAAVNYRDTRDQHVLLRLPMEERQVLQQILEGIDG